MASRRANVGIWGTVVTTVGGIITTVLLISQPTPPLPQNVVQTHDVTPTTSAAVGFVHVSTGGISAYVYRAPVEDPMMAHIGELSNGTQVQIVCTQQGPAQTGSNGTSTLWDKVVYNSSYGFLNDAEVNTNSDQAVAGTC